MAPLESNVSSDLVWFLVRGHNSFIVKRPHDGVRPLSAEPGNLTNNHSPRWSGLSSSKPVVLRPTKSGKGLHLSVVSSKATANQVAKKGRKQDLRAAANNRKTLSTVSKTVGQSRPDAYKAALGRASAILKSQRAPKQPRQHKPRGKKLVAAKAAHAKAAAASEE